MVVGIARHRREQPCRVPSQRPPLELVAQLERHAERLEPSADRRAVVEAAADVYEREDVLAPADVDACRRAHGGQLVDTALRDAGAQRAEDLTEQPGQPRWVAVGVEHQLEAPTW